MSAITQTALSPLDSGTSLAGPSHFIKTPSVGRRLPALDSESSADRIVQVSDGITL